MSDWDEIYLNGRVFINKLRQRRMVRYGNKDYAYSRVVWNCLHPQAPAIYKQDKQVIHHKDFDKLNDCPDNLEKMTHYEHHLIHREAKERAKKIYWEKYNKIKKKDRPLRIRWDLNKAARLKDLGFTFEEIGKQMNVDPGNLIRIFKKRELSYSPVKKRIRWDIETAIKMHYEGYSPIEISKVVGVRFETIIAGLRGHGCEGPFSCKGAYKKNKKENENCLQCDKRLLELVASYNGWFCSEGCATKYRVGDM